MSDGHVEELRALIGREFLSSWRIVTQDAIEQFAAVTGDRQWIHLDADLARRESPYGATVAHGFLSLSLITVLLQDAIGDSAGGGMAINYGLNKVRFPSPLRSGSRVRGRCTLQQLAPIDGGVQATWQVLVECDGAAKPCCAAEWLINYYAATAAKPAGC